MPSDLIKAASDRLTRDADRSLIEKAADRLHSHSVTPPAERSGAHSPPSQPPAAMSGRTTSAGTVETASPAPSSESAPARRLPPPITLDLGRLRAGGYITPNSMTTHIGEEFRIIKRPLLLRAFPDGGPPALNSNLIMVTSAQPNEGKTFISLNLSFSIALERNVHVLLIDADFHNPSVQGQLGFESDLGLIDVIADPSIDLANVIRRTNFPNFSVIAAGTPHRHATELLASARMAQLIDEIAHRYPDRVVLFDSPPLLAASEPSVLALHVGQIVFVVEAEATSRRAVDEALAFIAECPSVNIVLNKRRHWFGSKHFGGYYGYGSPPEAIRSSEGS